MNSGKDLEFIRVSWMSLFLEEWRLVALSFRKQICFIVSVYSVAGDVRGAGEGCGK